MSYCADTLLEIRIMQSLSSFTDVYPVILPDEFTQFQQEEDLQVIAQ